MIFIIVVVVVIIEPQLVRNRAYLYLHFAHSIEQSKTYQM